MTAPHYLDFPQAIIIRYFVLLIPNLPLICSLPKSSWTIHLPFANHFPMESGLALGQNSETEVAPSSCCVTPISTPNRADPTLSSYIGLAQTTFCRGPVRIAEIVAPHPN